MRPRARALHPGTALFGAALLVALGIAYLLRDTLGYVVRQPDGSYLGDITHYVYWTRLVTLGGIQAAYSGTWPETYAVYPPIPLYGDWLVGTLYRLLQDPTFDVERAQQSGWLRSGLKLAAMAWHVAAAIAVWWVARRQYGPKLGGIAGALFAVSPAALMDSAHWAQPDGAHSLFSVLAIGALWRGRAVQGWGAMSLAALAKPQAWAILPLLALGSLRLSTSTSTTPAAPGAAQPTGQGSRAPGTPPRPQLEDALSPTHPPAQHNPALSPLGPRRPAWLAGGLALARGLAVAAAVAVVVLLPFLLSGRLGELLSLPGVISTVMPVVTGNAHNVWWLLFARNGVDPLFSNDLARWIGPFNYRTAAAVLVLGQFALSYALYWTRRVGLAEAAALGALGWFLFTTQAHENHLFFVLPLLSIAWPARPRTLGPLFGVLSLTVFANLALHDQLLLEALGATLDDPVVRALRSANALLNVASYAVWVLLAARRPAGSASA